METFLTFSHLPHRFIYKREIIASLKKGPIPRNLADLKAFIGLFEKPDIFETALKQCELTLGHLQKTDIRLVPIYSPEYPQSLKKIPYCPWVLYYRGALPPSTSVGLGIVGTRKPNLYGLGVLEKILSSLKFSNLFIASGLAYGIDCKTHTLACDMKIKNFAVLGCGLTEIYPRTHASLAEKIMAEGGGILSEYPPQEVAHKSHFPWRNRIISGLSQLVWIVQGTKNSGSKHTAIHALEQGKTVCITPGDIFSELSEIPHEFLKEGAFPITSSSDLEELLENAQSSLHNFL